MQMQTSGVEGETYGGVAAAVNNDIMGNDGENAAKC